MASVGIWALWRRRRRLSVLALAAASLAIISAAAYLAVQSCRMLEAASPRHARITAGRLVALQAEKTRRTLLSKPRYRDTKRLNHFESKVYSQAGEDGIIREVFNRIGVTNRFFVEFGSGDGQENNTVFLLRSGWSGLWMDASDTAMEQAKRDFSREIQARRLTVLTAFITAENIEDLLGRAGVPSQFDLLSIDIDRNDYWVWSRIERYRPRAAVVEYNSTFPPKADWVVPYDPIAFGDGTRDFGASLAALERLGRKKGYLLVGCNFGGTNAFFVREDLAANHFVGPFTAENHYEPPQGVPVWGPRPIEDH